MRSHFEQSKDSNSQPMASVSIPKSRIAILHVGQTGAATE
jgi:hypothetical protein